MDLLSVALLTLAFHIGNFLSYLFNAQGDLIPIGIVAGGIVLLLLSTISFPSYFFGVLLTKFGIQQLRDTTKSRAKHSSEVFRIVPRMLGFALSFLFDPRILGSFVIAYILVHAMAWRGQLKSFGLVTRQFPMESGTPYFLMFTHSAHYFSYAYYIVILLYLKYSLGVQLIGAAYIVGWIGYYVVDKLLPSNKLYLSIGHFVGAVAILSLATIPKIEWFLLFWLLTGFGGGTIFMLPQLRANNPYSTKSMDIWDNGGNLVGIVLLLMALVFNAPALAFACAVTFSMASSVYSLKLR